MPAFVVKHKGSRLAGRLLLAAQSSICSAQASQKCHAMPSLTALTSFARRQSEVQYRNACGHRNFCSCPVGEMSASPICSRTAVGLTTLIDADQLTPLVCVCGQLTRESCRRRCLRMVVTCATAGDIAISPDQVRRGLVATLIRQVTTASRGCDSSPASITRGLSCTNIILHVAAECSF